MKCFRYILLALGVVVATGCDPRKHDDVIIDNLDPTRPGYILFAQSLKGVCAASGGLISALNFNEWLNATDERSRWELEDQFYPYRKIREREENLWDIYDSRSSERYLLHDGMSLGDEGAVWEIQRNPTFFYAEEASEVPTITRKAEDRFEIVFSYVPINIAMGSKRELFTYLNTWGNSKRAYFSALFTIATNNGAFRAGESDHLQFIITGEGELWDKDSSYSVAFEISEPLRVNFNDNGLIASNKASVGAMCITNSLGDWADVTMALYNTIVIDYHPKDGAPIRGYYDWNGTCITPR